MFTFNFLVKTTFASPWVAKYSFYAVALVELNRKTMSCLRDKDFGHCVPFSTTYDLCYVGKDTSKVYFLLTFLRHLYEIAKKISEISDSNNRIKKKLLLTSKL